MPLTLIHGIGNSIYVKYITSMVIVQQQRINKNKQNPIFLFLLLDITPNPNLSNSASGVEWFSTVCH